MNKTCLKTMKKMNQRNNLKKQLHGDYKIVGDGSLN